MSEHFGDDVSQSRLAQEFVVDFGGKKNDLTSKIETLETSNDFQDQIIALGKAIQTLNKSLHNATTFLPSYSIKKRQEEIRLLEKLLKDKEDILVPKRKFGFKSKIRNGALKESKIAVEENGKKDEVDNITSKISQSDALQVDSNFVTIEDSNNKDIIYEESDLDSADVMVRNLNNATVQLRGTPSTLRISGLKDCSLICGPVYTSIFVENCTNCKFYLCCQQLRTHSSLHIDIYLKVRARAIIEDCSDIRFAPYTYPHNKMREWHVRVNLDPDLERFDQVDDFNWLSNSQSPNWCVIPEEERQVFPT